MSPAKFKLINPGYSAQEKQRVVTPFFAQTKTSEEQTKTRQEHSQQFQQVSSTEDLKNDLSQQTKTSDDPSQHSQQFQQVSSTEKPDPSQQTTENEQVSAQHSQHSQHSQQVSQTEKPKKRTRRTRKEPNTEKLIDQQIAAELKHERTKYEATEQFWAPILTELASDFDRVYRLRTGMPSSFWFSRWSDAEVQRATLASLIGLDPVRLTEFAQRYPFQQPQSRSELIVAAARILMRLMDVSCGAFSDLRAWFGRTRDEHGWFSGLGALSRTNLHVNAVSLEHFLWVLDSYYDFAIRFCKIPNATLANLSKSRESGRELYGKQCWDLMPLATILHYSYLQGLHPMAVLTVLWTKEREFCARKGYLPSLRPDYLVKHIPSITSEEAQRIPRYDQQHLVDWQYAFGLAGDVKLPERILFGWDFSKVHVDGLHPISVSDGGQVVYRRLSDKVILSEGHPLTLNPVVKGWGSPALQIWMTRANYAELLPHWHNPPSLCPWTWYSRFGNGVYRADGTAVNPDTRLRPSVIWFERANCV